MAVRLPPRRLWYEHELEFFLYAMSTVVQRLPVELTSWYRDDDHNREVGGHPRSQHLVGLAMDLTGEEWALREVAEKARNMDLTVVEESDHLHIQMFPAGYLERRAAGQTT